MTIKWGSDPLRDGWNELEMAHPIELNIESEMLEYSEHRYLSQDRSD